MTQVKYLLPFCGALMALYLFYPSKFFFIVRVITYLFKKLFFLLIDILKHITRKWNSCTQSIPWYCCAVVTFPLLSELCVKLTILGVSYSKKTSSFCRLKLMALGKAPLLIDLYKFHLTSTGRWNFSYLSLHCFCYIRILEGTKFSLVISYCDLVISI